MKSRKIRGAVVTEALLSMTITSLVLLGSIVALLVTLSGWYRGEARIQAEVEVQQALRYVRDTLREALYVEVDADREGVTYRLPKKDGDGNIIYPMVWDGVERRFEITDGAELVSISDGDKKVLLHDVVLTDTDGTDYDPFTPGNGAIIRQLAVQLVTKRLLRECEDNPLDVAYGRCREIVVLRNAPSAGF
ncbi:MAG TPA: hypothetical protein VNK96_03355 [Fimbriimonadales bacterium]|nr:hypothetical protein [Fimbriimonadales bacterium]